MIWKFDNRWYDDVYKKACVLSNEYGMFDVRYYYGGGSCDKNKPNVTVQSKDEAIRLAKEYVGMIK